MDIQVLAMSIIAAIIFVLWLEKIDNRYAATFIIAYVITVPVLMHMVIHWLP